MKVSNETKVGALAAIVITLLFLGYNFLQGKKLFSNQFIVYAVYDNISGLNNSAQVKYKGLIIGSTGVSKKMDQQATKIVVPITIFEKDILIPKNSIAIISSAGLGINSADLEIKQGDDKVNFLKSGDTIRTNAPSDMLSEVTKQLNPVLYEVKNAVHSLDSVLLIIANTFDPSAKSNFQSILANVNRITANLISTSSSLNNLLAAQSGSIDKSLGNMVRFTDNLNTNNQKINSMISNLDKTSSNFAALKLDQTMKQLDNSLSEFQTLLKKFSNDKGSLGLLLNDPDLYNQMHSLTFSLNTLVDDLKVNPKRYISIFGRKDKKIDPLKKPILDSVPKNK